jgi:hypothetical protein
MAARFQTRPQAQTTNHKATQRKQELMTTYVEALLDEAKIAFTELDQNKWAYNRIAKFNLPGSGAPAKTTYWTLPSDPEHGVPFVLLLQGERDRETGQLHPERLPGGKTAIQLLNQRLNEIDAPAGVQLLFEKSSKELHVYIVDLDRMDDWEAFVKQQSVPAPSTRKPAPKPQVKAPAEVDEDGFQMVRRK